MESETVADADLLRAHAAGDGRAFAQLYDRYDRSAYLFIRRLLGAAHAEAAEDLHQETWLSVARNSRSFDPARASFRVWLFTIARNKVWDHFRRQKVAVLASAAGEDEGLMVADPAPSPLDAVQSRETAARLLAAVEALPLAQRDAFVMVSQAGLSLQEAADITGAGLETVKSRLRYAREALRRALSDERPHG